MNLLRHQLAKPRTIKYMIKFRNSKGAATFLPTAIFQHTQLVLFVIKQRNNAWTDFLHFRLVSIFVWWASESSLGKKYIEASKVSWRHVSIKEGLHVFSRVQVVGHLSCLFLRIGEESRSLIKRCLIQDKGIKYLMLCYSFFGSIQIHSIDCQHFNFL